MNLIKACTIFCFIALAMLANAQTAHLILQGDPGELISGGNSYDVTYTLQNSPQQFINVDQLSGGLPAGVLFRFFPPPGSFPDAILAFSTDQLGQPLIPGTYTDAQRADFAQPGHPGLEVDFNGLGGNTVAGDFTIQDAVFSPDPKDPSGWKIIQFDATFNQRVDDETATLHGSFSYSAVSVPEPTTFTLAIFTLGILGYTRRIGLTMRRR